VDLSLAADLIRERAFVLLLHTGVGLAPFLDAIRTSVESRGTAGLDFELGFPQENVTLRVAAAITNPIADSAPPAADPNVFDTSQRDATFSVRIPFTYRIDENVAVEGGWQMLMRGPDLTTGGGFPDRDFLGYIAFSL